MKTQYFARQKQRNLHFACRQWPSNLFVWNPSLFTNSFEWFTNRCLYPCFSKFNICFPTVWHNCCSLCNVSLYQRQQCRFIALVYCCHKTPSRILFNSTENPLSLDTWYVLFPNLFSSISTTLPFSLCSKSVISHVSQQKLSQSTAGSDV